MNPLSLLLTSTIVSASFALTGTVKDPAGLPLSNVAISYDGQDFTTDSLGVIKEGKVPVKYLVKAKEFKDLSLVRNTLEINLNNYQNPVQVKITSLQGRQISSKNIQFSTNGKQSISINDLSSHNLSDGIYFVNLRFNNENHLLNLNTVHNSANILSSSKKKTSASTSANKYSSTATFVKAGYEQTEEAVVNESVGDVTLPIADPVPEIIDAPFFMRNFFFPDGWDGDKFTPANKCTVSVTETEAMREGSIGKSYYKFTWTPGTDSSWYYVNWLFPTKNWGSEERGHTVTNAKKISFWVKGDTKGDTLEFHAGAKDWQTSAGIGKFNNSFHISQNVALDTVWTQVTLDLTKLPEEASLSNDIIGFGWIASVKQFKEKKLKPITFYIDDIIYK